MNFLAKFISRHGIFLLLVLGALTLSVFSSHSADAQKLYTCGMHPQVIQDHPGNCPICGMKLTLIRKPATFPQASAK